MHLQACVCVADVEKLGWQKLPKFIIDYYKGGADDEQTLARNLKGFNRYIIFSFAFILSIR